MEVVTLVNTLHHSLAEVKAEKQGDTLRDLEAKALADTLADRLAEVKYGKLAGLSRMRRAHHLSKRWPPRWQRWRPRRLAKHWPTH